MSVKFNDDKNLSSKQKELRLKTAMEIKNKKREEIKNRKRNITLNTSEAFENK